MLSAVCARVQIGVDVAAAKTVDRLLRIADHDEAAPGRGVFVAVDAIEDRVLLQVGILELVDQRDRPRREQTIGERNAASAAQTANDALDQLVERHARRLPPGARRGVRAVPRGSVRASARVEGRADRRQHVGGAAHKGQ